MKKNTGITLIALIITIVVLIILASVVITLSLGDNGILTKTQIAKDENSKQLATEKINLKITNIQMDEYTKSQSMPTLQKLADNLCEDSEIEYVNLSTQKTSSLDKIIVGENQNIFTKLKMYPYEFEINSSLQLASVDGIKISSTNEENTINYKDMTIKFDFTTNKLKYFYNDNEILPIYWYGFEPSVVGTLSPWYESNCKSILSRQANNFLLTRTNSASTLCHAGLTSSFPINLSKYSSFHIVINSSASSIYTQYVSYTGNRGSDYNSCEKYNLQTIPKVTNGPTEYSVNISSVSGSYYLGFGTKSSTGTYNIAAMWVE